MTTSLLLFLFFLFPLRSRASIDKNHPRRLCWKVMNSLFQIFHISKYFSIHQIFLFFPQKKPISSSSPKIKTKSFFIYSLPIILFSSSNLCLAHASIIHQSSHTYLLTSVTVITPMEETQETWKIPLLSSPAAINWVKDPCMCYPWFLLREDLHAWGVGFSWFPMCSSTCSQ